MRELARNECFTNVRARACYVTENLLGERLWMAVDERKRGISVKRTTGKERGEERAHSWNTTENTNCWIRNYDNRLCLSVFYGVLRRNNSKNSWHPRRCTAFLTNATKIRIFMERWKICTSWIPCKLICHFRSLYSIQNILCYYLY